MTPERFERLIKAYEECIERVKIEPQTDITVDALVMMEENLTCLLNGSGTIHSPILINQLCKFPAVKHDDAVDVCALMAMAIPALLEQQMILPLIQKVTLEAER